MPINSRINNKDYEPKRRHPITLGDDSNLEQNLKPFKIDNKNTILELSDSELKVRGTIDASAITVDGASVQTGSDAGATQLNELSDVTYSSGDLTITSLDTIVATNLTIKVDDTEKLSGRIDGEDNDYFELAGEAGTYSSLKLFEMGGNSTTDYFKINVEEHGVATISTVDAAATAANLTLQPDGDLVLDPASRKTIINAADKLYFDAGTHTYLHESGDDKLEIVVGADRMLTLDEASDAVTIAATNWIAGTVSGDTVTEFSAANSGYAGMILGYTRLQGDLTNQGTYEIQNNITVEDDTHKVTFKTPPSEFVEIEATFAMNITTTGTMITAGLSDADASTGYNSIGVEYEFDYLGVFLSDGEADDGVYSCKWVLPAAELAAIGSSNTFWIGFGTAGSTKTAFLTYGVRATHGIMTAPFIIKATALPATIYDGQ